MSTQNSNATQKCSFHIICAQVTTHKMPRQPHFFTGIPAPGVNLVRCVQCKVTIVVLHGHNNHPRHIHRVLSMPWVTMDSNLQNTIWHEHTLPTVLRPWYEKCTPWPRDYYRQADRGSDMLCKEAIALEVMNVLKGVFDNVYMSHLPVRIITPQAPDNNFGFISQLFIRRLLYLPLLCLWIKRINHSDDTIRNFRRRCNIP